MPSIRITRFAGLMPEVNPEDLRNDQAQIAHNCLLWDGWLRPLPQWQVWGTYPSQPFSLVKTPWTFGGFTPDFELSDAIIKSGEPFAVTNVGMYFNSIRKRFFGSEYIIGLPIPTIYNISQIITNNFQSTYPIPRVYALTYLSGNSEGPPFVFPYLGDEGGLFEGDIVNLQFSIDTANVSNRIITGYRLYRTVPNFDTAEQIGNSVETAFHLVEEGSFYTGFGYVVPNFIAIADSAKSDQIPGDVLLTDQFMEPTQENFSFPSRLVETESGWLVSLHQMQNFEPKTFLQISERYLWDAWPPQNSAWLPEEAVDIAVFYDDVYIGTTGRPYHMRVSGSETDALELTIHPFTNEYACVPGTLVTTNFGAMYASKDGLIALDTSNNSVVTKKIANPGDILGEKGIKFDSALRSAWWNGTYYGFCGNVAYLFNVPNSTTNDFPLGQLVTMDTPSGSLGVNIATAYGLFSLWGNILYTLPLPGYGYENATKLPFQWRSKRYVLPGLYTMAAAKVVNDGSGTLNFALYGDGKLILSRAVTSSEPFRLPHQHKCIEWEIEISGTSVVNEVHVATSIRDLVEEPVNG